MKVRQIDTCKARINNDSRQVNFGKVIEIEKAIIDGVDSHEVADIAQAARNLGDILLKTKDDPKGKSIRALISRMTGDYRSPRKPINNGETPIVEMNIGEEGKYFATGKEAEGFYGIGYWRWMINHEVAHGRMQESCLKDLEPGGALDKAIIKIVENPESKIPSNKKLVLHGTRVPIESELIKSITGEDTEVKLTDISFVK